MRLHLPKSLILPALALSTILVSCDRDLTTNEDQPKVDYVLIVTDSVTSVPLDSVRIKVRAINGDTSTYFTDRLEGRAELATMASSRTLFVLSKAGYRSLDILDTLNAKPDTVFDRAVQRLLRVKMVNLVPDTGRVQLQLLIRGPDLQKLNKGRVSYTDSSGNDRTETDGDGDGIIGLSNLNIGKTQVRVEHAAYLGRLMDVNVEKGADSVRRAPSVTVVLLDLKNNISGQVYRKTATTPKPLLDAKVEFHLKDSSAYPKVFRTYTASEEGQNGRYNFAEVPALEGELWFFKDRNSSERSKVLALTKEEVLMEGSLPLVTLDIALDSLIPLLSSGPGKNLPGKDTLASKDTLAFKFNQAVGRVQGIAVRQVNGTEVWIDSSWNKDKTILRVWQREAGWVEGKKYEYEISLTNDQGKWFSVPGDSSESIQGTFLVRVADTASDSTLLYARDIRLAYFNSGNHYLFAAADTSSSPKADSTSQFVRLKWTWDEGKGHRVDSLLIFYKDGASVANWSRWGSLPGHLDSAYLSFSEHYSTVQVPSQKPRFPLRDSVGEVFFKIIPKYAGRTLDRRDTTLDALTQGMGPTVYVKYIDKDSLKIGPGMKDSIEVTFRERFTDGSSEWAWGASSIRPTPKIYLDDKEPPVGFSWRWISEKRGLLVYTLPPTLVATHRLRVDLNGVLYQGKPIWQRNSKDEKALQ